MSSHFKWWENRVAGISHCASENSWSDFPGWETPNYQLDAVWEGWRHGPRSTAKDRQICPENEKTLAKRERNPQWDYGCKTKYITELKVSHVRKELRATRSNVAKPNVSSKGSLPNSAGCLSWRHIGVLSADGRPPKRPHCVVNTLDNSEPALELVAESWQSLTTPSWPCSTMPVLVGVC